MRNESNTYRPSQESPLSPEEAKSLLLQMLNELLSREQQTLQILEDKNSQYLRFQRAHAKRDVEPENVTQQLNQQQRRVEQLKGKINRAKRSVADLQDLIVDEVTSSKAYISLHSTPILEEPGTLVAVGKKRDLANWAYERGVEVLKETGSSMAAYL